MLYVYFCLLYISIDVCISIDVYISIDVWGIAHFVIENTQVWQYGKQALQYILDLLCPVEIIITMNELIFCTTLYYG